MILLVIVVTVIKITKTTTLMKTAAETVIRIII